MWQHNHMYIAESLLEHEYNHACATDHVAVFHVTVLLTSVLICSALVLVSITICSMIVCKRATLPRLASECKGSSH